MRIASTAGCEPPRPSRAFRREVARIAREADMRLAELRRRGAGAGGRRLVAAELLGMDATLADPVLGPHAVEALAAAYGAAHGAGAGMMSECLTCRGPWTVERVPVAAVRITIGKPHSVMLALVCGGCVDLGRTGFQAVLREALARDFFGGGPVDLVSAATVAPGGRA